MGKGKKPRTYEKDGKASEKERTLQKKIKEQEREISRLKSELKTLNVAFKKSAAYMSEESKDLSVKELIDAANKNQTLSQVKKEQAVIRPPSKEELERKKQEVLDKVRKWRKETLGEYEEE